MAETSIKDLQVSLSFVTKVLGLIGTIVLAWIFMTSNFVMASQYHDDQLAMRATLLGIQIDMLQSRVDRANEDGHAAKERKLEHQRERLEREQEMVMEKQLDH
jgi:uncharacterized membrane protein (DUF106 family)